MGRTILAEDKLLQYLIQVSSESKYAVGLILGQASSNKDYVIHLSRTPRPDANETDVIEPTVVLSSVSDIRESWVSDHAKHVTRMLPGGMWVLGLFVCSPTDLFGDSTTLSKLKSVLINMKMTLTEDPLLHANSPSDKLLFHFNSHSHKYLCKSLDVSNIQSNFKPADWKFQSNITKWYQVNSHFDLDQPAVGGNMSLPLKSQLKSILKEVDYKLQNAFVTLDNEVRDSKDSLEVVTNKGKKKRTPQKTVDSETDSRASSAVIFVPCSNKSVNSAESEDDIEIKSCDVELHLLGVLASRVYLNQNATVGDAVEALKQDIVRSLTARLEMHWDSLIDEEYGSPEEKRTVHGPPTRVIVQLADSKITFSDYLFPGEGPSEVVTSFKELLDLAIQEGDVQNEFESQADAKLFYSKDSSISVDTSSSDDFLRPSIPTGVLIAVLTVAVLLIAVAVAIQLQRRDRSSDTVE